jgi:hypothetical protein
MGVTGDRRNSIFRRRRNAATKMAGSRSDRDKFPRRYDPGVTHSPASFIGNFP